MICLLLAPTSGHGFEAKDLLAFSAGPFVVRPKVSANETFNDNLFFGSEDQESALITGVTPGVDVRLGRPEGDRVFHFKYDFGQYWYHDVAQIDTAVSHNLALTGAVRGERLSSDTAFSYGFSDTVYGGYEGFSQGAVTGGSNVGRTTFNLSEALRYQISHRSATYGQFTLNDLDFDESEFSNFYDQNVWRIMGGFGYRVRPKVEAIGEVYYGQTASNPNSLFYRKPPHLETVGGFLGANLSFTTKLSGTVKAGYEQANAKPDSRGIEVDSGIPVANIALTSALTEHSSATLSYARATGASVQSGASVYTGDYFGLQLRHVFGSARPWVLTAGGSYGLNYYEPQTTSAGQVVPGYDLDYLAATLGVAYQPRLWLTLGLQYQYSQSSGSSVSGVDYSANEFTLFVSLGY